MVLKKTLPHGSTVFQTPAFLRSNMFFIEPNLFFIPVLVAPSLFFITVSVGASGEGPGPCQRLACRSPSLASKWSPAMWGHARGVNFDAQVAAWREAYGKTGWCCTGLQLIETPFAHIECWLLVCTLPWLHQLLTARNFGSFFCCTCMPAVVLSALIADGMIHPRSWAVLGKVEAKLLGSCGTHVPWTPCPFRIQGCHRGQRTRRYWEWVLVCSVLMYLRQEKTICIYMWL